MQYKLKFPMSNPQVLVAGGVNLDTTYYMKAIPGIGESVCAKGKSSAFGGKGLNQALAIQRAGTPAGIIGAVGCDSVGDNIRRFLDAEGISSSLLSILSDVDTGRAVIFVDDHADNSIVVNPGANAMTNARIVSNIGDAWKDIRTVVANGEAPPALVERFFGEARKRQIRTVWNPSPMPTAVSSIMHLSDTLIVNETEAKELTQSDDHASCLIEQLAVMGPTEVVITLGRKGSLVNCEGRLEHFSALKVKAVDPTAAGDTFLGYYVASRSRNMSAAKSAAFASKAAAMCVQVRGAAHSIPTNDAVEFVATGQNTSEIF